MKFNNVKSFIIVFIVLVIVSCKDYYNDTINWADNLENKLTVKEVQKVQPEFIEIDWQNPLKVDNQKWYMITKIKGNNDVLAMSHYLVFIEGEYQYRKSIK